MRHLFPSESWAACGNPAIIGVRNIPGAIVMTPNAMLREVARDRQRKTDHTALCSPHRLPADLAVIGGDRCRVDDHAALFLVRLPCGKPGRDLERSC